MGENINSVTLTWPNHSRHIAEGLWKCLLEKYKTDVELACSNGYQVKAHKLMLSILSPSLKNILSSEENERQGETSTAFLRLDYTTVDGKDMEHLMEFVYRGRATLPSDKVDSVHMVAKHLGMENVAVVMEKQPYDDATNSNMEPSTSDNGEDAQQLIGGGNGRRKRKSIPSKIPSATIDEADSENHPSSESAMGCRKKRQKSKRRKRQCVKTEADASGDEYDEDCESEIASDGLDVTDDDDDGDWCQESETLQGTRETSVECNEMVSNVSNASADGQEQQKNESSSGRMRLRSAVSKRLGKARKSTAYKRIWRQNQPLQKCPHCKYQTRDKDCYSSHVAKHDPAADRYICNFCGKKFRSKRGFIHHRNAHLSPDNLLKCSHCTYQTPLKSSLVQHLVTIHRVDADGNPFVAKFRCTECDFSCQFECQLKLHVLRKHERERPFKCAECEYGAVLKTDLDKHISIRHRQERKYMCEICGFRSQSQGGHKRHARTHTGEKPFKCDICGKRYADNRKFKIHQQQHINDEKPFVCHICGHACRRKDNLQMHIRRIHKSSIDGVLDITVTTNINNNVQMGGHHHVQGTMLEDVLVGLGCEDETGIDSQCCSSSVHHDPVMSNEQDGVGNIELRPNNSMNCNSRLKIDSDPTAATSDNVKYEVEVGPHGGSVDIHCPPSNEQTLICASVDRVLLFQEYVIP